MEAFLYAEVYLICIIITSIPLLWTLRYDQNSTRDIWLKTTFRVFLVNFLSNFLFVIFSRMMPVSNVTSVVSYILKSVYIMTLAIGTYCWCGFSEAVIKSELFDTKNKGRYFLIFPALMCLAVLSNIKYRWIFDIGPGGEYLRYSGFQILLLFELVFSSMFSIRFIRQSRSEMHDSRRVDILVTAGFPVCLLAALALTFLGEKVPVVCVCVTVALLSLYISNMNYQISTDRLTMVNNRQNLMGYLEYKMKNNDGDLWLIMIDIDSFKSINDTYGHVEGDAALVSAASFIKQACGPFSRRPYISRYGGDEFIVVMEGSENEVKSLESNISYMAEKLASPEKPYRITFSMGHARYEEGMDDREFIARADSELYKNKNSAKRRV